jgi:N-formylglutamate deformylase
MTDQNCFRIIPPVVEPIPFVLSIPHCGTSFPIELKSNYKQDIINNLDDTDWNLDMLYDFAPELGITTIIANYSRWVIDLNRDPANKSLYNDGRIITSLCPTTNFLGENIYHAGKEPNSKDIDNRLHNYYWPYHEKINDLIHDFKTKFNTVFFWDAHSIRRHVPTINPEPFPDLIIGDNDGKTADSNFIKTCFDQLLKSNLYLTHNTPFKGGNLTRSKGNPSKKTHAIQLEMSKDLYMNKEETKYDYDKARVMKSILKSTFENIIPLLK